MKMNKKVILFASGLIVLVLISLCVAGPFGWFGRSSGGCANGVCNAPEPEPTPDTVVVTPVEVPDNVLLHVPKTQTKTNVEAVKNEILTKPLCVCVDSTALCTCNSKETCTCISCNCEACPMKRKPNLGQTVKKNEEVNSNESCEQTVQQYEYYERPRLFRRIFGRR